MSTARFRKQGGYKQARNIGTSSMNADGGISTRSHISFHDLKGSGATAAMPPGTLIWKSENDNGRLEYKDNNNDWNILDTRGYDLWKPGTTGIHYDGGNVGIGTTGPAAKLDISGNIHVNTENYKNQIGYFTGASGATGNNSTAIGYQTKASGDWSTAMGYQTLATGAYSTAMGAYSGATGDYCTAIGNRAYAGGEIQFAIGASGTPPNTIAGSGTANNNALVILKNGRVGIGTNSPTFPLHVESWTNQSFSSSYQGYYFNSGQDNFHTKASGNLDVSIRSLYYVMAQGFVAVSDERIKENIIEVPDNLALQMLRDIDCNYYEYKDKIAKGAQQTIGFIAQQVKEHLDMAVSLQKEIIPNEMRVLESTWDGLNMSSDLTDVSGVKYRFYVSNNTSGNDEMKKEVVGNDDNTFTFDKKYNNVFCYGKEVNDFHTLDKQKLFALNFSATQEIDKIQQEEKTKFAAAESKITDLETENATLKAQLSGFEARLVALEAK
jgi:hypothetical protein